MPDKLFSGKTGISVKIIDKSIAHRIDELGTFKQ
jgi:hypothetical protein